MESKQTVLNFVPCDNEFELNFARFLDKAEDLDAFAKLPEQFGFCIQYTDSLANIRNYYPDFVVRLKDGSHWLIETKGREDIEVAMKDLAAQHWCDTASELPGVVWNYLKVLQKDFEKLQPEGFDELTAAVRWASGSKSPAHVKSFLYPNTCHRGGRHIEAFPLSTSRFRKQLKLALTGHLTKKLRLITTPDAFETAPKKANYPGLEPGGTVWLPIGTIGRFPEGIQQGHPQGHWGALVRVRRF